MVNFLRFVLILVLLIFSLSIQAQRRGSHGSKRKHSSADYFAQNRFMVGVSTAGSIFNKKGIGTVNLKLGYFVINGLSIGLGGEYKISGVLNTEKLGGGYARYYFSQNRFSPFAEANYFSGKGQIKGDPDKYKVSQIGGAAGLSYAGILKVLGVEAFADFFQESVTANPSKFYYFLSVRVYATF